MTKQTIAGFLKQLRRISGFSANEVTDRLQEYDINISAKTLYGYESGLSMPNADAFVALCKIYRCDNPLALFGTPALKSDELGIIEKYRDLDSHGKEMVDFTLLKEWERSTAEAAVAPKTDNVIPMAVQKDASCLNAAHAEDYAGAPEELRQLEEAIMDDEDF